jgi:hypothetical protein
LVIIASGLMRPQDLQTFRDLDHAGLLHGAVDLDETVETGAHHAKRSARRARYWSVAKDIDPGGKKRGCQIRTFVQVEDRAIKGHLHARAFLKLKKRRSGSH